MKHSQTRGIILRRINYGEADRILTIISNEQGKLSLLAKGARRSKSKLAGGLELFSVADINYIDGRSNLKTVTSTQLVHYYGEITKNYKLTMLAYEFLKMIDDLTQDSCEPSYFELLENSFEALAKHDEHISVIQAWFLCRLLLLSGVNINLENQVAGNSFDESKNYQFSFDDMAFFSHPAGVYLPKHIKFLRLLEKVSKPENLLHVSGASELASQINPLLTQCVKSQ